ncbi:diacylglycerol O-acyltransferase 1 [Elasticomyces elasticus]|nr:diacylglycerol O-acyltransferase 1 [Elasticomyces elasticus]KAK3648668.1 diacylglycerol O-acyltransferase 1 [Elasticomyces elasticus]KAK4932449.1 diacylglycerol O-acyltransferase 1 [Elasticomyces elasticus]KAK5760150.1 diacylglycerol O-acyltransferase 1 [Elasticomyces elasticus]
MIANSKRFTPPSLRAGSRGKNSPIRPKSGIMSLDLEVADAIARQDNVGSPKTPRFNSAEYEVHDDESVDEDAIKESPPRPPKRNISGSVHSRHSSEPRPLGEVMDDFEAEERRNGGAGSPSLRHTKGRLESKGSWEKDGTGKEESYADVVKEGTPGEGNVVASGNGAPPIPVRSHPTLMGNRLDPSIGADGRMGGGGGGVGGMGEERIREEGLEHISEEGTVSSERSGSNKEIESNVDGVAAGEGLFGNGNGSTADGPPRIPSFAPAPALDLSTNTDTNRNGSFNAENASNKEADLHSDDSTAAAAPTNGDASDSTPGPTSNDDSTGSHTADAPSTLSRGPLGIMTNGNGNGNGIVAKHAIQGTRTPETYEAVGADESPRSPVRKAHKRVSSRSLNGSAKKQMVDAPSSEEHDTDATESKDTPQPTQPTHNDGIPKIDELLESISPKSTSIPKIPAFLSLDGSSSDEARTEEKRPHFATRESKAAPGDLVMENLRNRSGENLASIKPWDATYQSNLALAEREFTGPVTSTSADEDNAPALPERKAGHKRDNSELVSGRRAGAGWGKSAIRWAPLNVPLQRRLQTCMVLLHTLSIAGGLALFFLLCTVPLLWPILLPYLLYVLLSRASIDGRLSQRSEWCRRSKVWSLFAGYFPARLHRTEELVATRKYVFGYHPHGIISHGAFAAFGTEALGFSQLFPGITNTLLTLDANFRIPLYRDYALRMGLASVSRESCENILSKGGANGEGMGRAITIVVGGARESLDAKPRTLRLVLRRRKGFVKLAIRAGADLVPVLSFGENDLYEQFDGGRHPYVHQMQMFVKRVAGFTVPLFHARGVFNYDVGLMPYRRPINIVVGRAIRVQQFKNPEVGYVDEIHGAYMRELERIWEEWKGTFARGREGEMEVVE